MGGGIGAAVPFCNSYGTNPVTDPTALVGGTWPLVKPGSTEAYNPNSVTQQQAGCPAGSLGTGDGFQPWSFWSYAGGNCNCDHYKGGCKVATAASPMNACKCSYKGFWTCTGSVTSCASPYSKGCLHPASKSVEVCNQGGGDCGGY